MNETWIENKIIKTEKENKLASHLLMRYCTQAGEAISSCEAVALYKVANVLVDRTSRGEWESRENIYPVTKRLIEWRNTPVRRPPRIRERSAPLTLEERFIQVARSWKKETAGFSFAAKKITNEHYLTIIGMGVTMGEPIIRLILQDLQKGVEHWNYALKKITKQNPVSKEHIHDLRHIRDTWLKWGKENNLL